LRFELAQMCYYINIEIIKSSSSFLLFYTPIYYIIDIKFAHKTPYENPHMRPHTAYAVCDDHPHVYWNPYFKSLVMLLRARPFNEKRMNLTNFHERENKKRREKKNQFELHFFLPGDSFWYNKILLFRGG
jgi:hypothetical protein